MNQLFTCRCVLEQFLREHMSDRKVQPRKRSKALDGQSISGNSRSSAIPAQNGDKCLSVRVTDAVNARTPLLLLEKSDSGFAAKQLGPQDLSVLAVLSTAAAQQEDLFDCLASFSRSTQAKTEQLHMACKGAVSAFKSQESPRTQNNEEYLRAATAVKRLSRLHLNQKVRQVAIRM